MTTKEVEQLNQKIKAIKAKKDAAAVEYARLAKQKASKERKETVHREWQRLWDELKDLYAKKKDLTAKKEVPRSKKELAIEHLKKANIRQDPRFVRIVEDVLKETKDKTPEEIRDLITEEVEGNEDLNYSFTEWVLDSYKGELLNVWQRLQLRKSKIYNGKKYAKRNKVEVFKKGRDKFEDAMVRMNALTTQFYKKQEMDKLTVYRGVNDSRRYYRDMKPGEKKLLQANPLSSWSEDSKRAELFGRVVLKMSFPVERILTSGASLSGYLVAREREVILDAYGSTISTDDFYTST